MILSIISTILNNSLYFRLLKCIKNFLNVPLIPFQHYYSNALKRQILHFHTQYLE